MTYFPDNSEYVYLSHDRGGKNIGWLSAEHPFPKGTVPFGFMTRLADACFTKSANMTRGFHICELCSVSRPSVRQWFKKRPLGTGEIHITGGDGTVFKAPDLIYHYVKDHDYRPPEDFIRAVMHQE